ncbi:MAG: hypothetical protein ABW133_16925 [Polyangiaceae bacterium]
MTKTIPLAVCAAALMFLQTPAHALRSSGVNCRGVNSTEQAKLNYVIPWGVQNTAGTAANVVCPIEHYSMYPSVIDTVIYDRNCSYSFPSTLYVSNWWDGAAYYTESHNETTSCQSGWQQQVFNVPTGLVVFVAQIGSSIPPVSGGQFSHITMLDTNSL